MHSRWHFCVIVGMKIRIWVQPNKDISISWIDSSMGLWMRSKILLNFDILDPQLDYRGSNSKCFNSRKILLNFFEFFTKISFHSSLILLAKIFPESEIFEFLVQNRIIFGPLVENGVFRLPVFLSEARLFFLCCSFSFSGLSSVSHNQAHVCHYLWLSSSYILNSYCLRCCISGFILLRRF